MNRHRAIFLNRCGVGVYLLGILVVGGTAFTLALASTRGALQTSHGSVYIALGTGGLCYAASHILRALRLAYLASDARIGVRRVLYVHMHSAAVSLCLPFKTGELYRLAELANVFGSFLRTLSLVVVARTFDVAGLLLLALVAFFLDVHGQATLRVFTLVCAGLLSVSLCLLFVLPEQLRGLSLYVLRRHQGRHVVKLLRGLSTLRSSLLNAAKLASGKVPFLVAISALIWTLEIATVALTLPGGQGGFRDIPEFLVKGLMGFITYVDSMPQKLYQGLVLGQEIVLDQYQLVVASVVFTLGLVAGLVYLPHRLRIARYRADAIRYDQASALLVPDNQEWPLPKAERCI